MKILEELKYTKTHEWIKVDGDTVTCGITDWAQSELSDIVFIEFHDVGSEVKKGDAFGTIEAVKAVSDLFAPMSGKITETNETVADSPDVINKDPYGEGWMVKIEMSSPDELNTFLTPDEYAEHTKK